MSVLIALGIGALILLRLAVEGIQEMVVQYKVNKRRHEQIEFEKQVGQAVLAYFEKEKEREEREAPPPGLTKESAENAIYRWDIREHKMLSVDYESLRWDHEAECWVTTAHTLDAVRHYTIYVDKDNQVWEEVIDEQRSQNAHS